MTNELTVFNFDGQNVRTTQYNGEIAFVAKDVLERLEYEIDGGVGKYVKHVPDEWRGGTPISTPSGTQEMLVLTEQGLYFFLARSDKPKALPFQKWIAGEVVPAIRKHGGYLTEQKIEEILQDPDTIIRLATNLKIEREKRLAAESANIALTTAVQQRDDYIEEKLPAIVIGDHHLTNGTYYTVQQFSDGLKNHRYENAGPNQTFEYFRSKGLLYKDRGQNRWHAWFCPENGINQPTGGFTRNNGSHEATTRPLLTAKGIVYLLTHFYEQDNDCCWTKKEAETFVAELSRTY